MTTQSPTPIFVLSVLPLRVKMQLNVVSLTESLAHVLVPGIGREFQLGMLVFEPSESELLHQVGEKRRPGVVLLINLQQRSQRRELNLLDLARAIAAQFPVVSQG